MTKQNIQIIGYGSTVQLKSSDVDHTVIGALIRGTHVEYEVVAHAVGTSDQMRKQYWITDAEINDGPKPPKRKIGYK